MGALAGGVDDLAGAAAGNAWAHAALVADLRERLAHAWLGGSARARQRHVERGKLLPRDRVDSLVDPASPF
ncbi:MAG: methylcrotonoyl-CoA carboxylase, partial [Pseudonocardiaceae bacterium]